MTQIKKIRVLIDEEVEKCNQQRLHFEQVRLENLREIGNIVHDTVPVSNDEVHEIKALFMEKLTISSSCYLYTFITLT